MMKKGGAVYRIASNNPFLPDCLLTSVLSLTPVLCRDLDVTHLVFDVDRTLAPKKSMVLTDAYRKHLVGLRKAGLKIYIGSNARRDLRPLAESVGAVIIPPTRVSFKPFRSYFRGTSKMIRAAPVHTAMVGDRIINDIVGANRAGFVTILVDPVHAVEREPVWWRRLYTDWVMKHAE